MFQRNLPKLLRRILSPSAAMSNVAAPSVFVQKLNPMTGQSEWKMQAEDYDYRREVARAAFADMLHDTERNRLYYEGLEAAIQEKRRKGQPVHVLDIGTGTGLLSMMAARIGADSITAIEEFRPMAECATRVMASNGFGDQIKLVRKRSTYVEVGPGKDMERRANILVTEVFDTELIGEGAISTFNHAHQHLLTEDCLVVPTKAIMYAQVVSSDLAARWNRLHPIDLPGTTTIRPPGDGADSSTSLALHDVQLSEVRPEWFQDVSGKQEVFRFDFSGRSGPIPVTRQSAVSFKCRSSASSCDAVFMWWECKMDPREEITMSCAPKWAHPTPHQLAWRDHWMQAIYYPLSKTEAKQDQNLTLVSNHDEYSLWFDVLQKEAKLIGQIPMPDPTSGIHLAVSRNRLGQINDSDRNRALADSIKSLFAKHKGDSAPTVLCLSEQSLLPLFAAALGASKVLVREENPQFRRFLESTFESNGLSDKLQLLEKPFSDLTSEDHSAQLVVAEPNFGLSLLPWHNLLFWFCLQEVSPDSERLLPATVEKAELWGVPVAYKDLWKIRSPLYQVEGFAMGHFDEIIMDASEIGDDKVEPHPLWEYPCRAKSTPQRLMSFDLTRPVPTSAVASNTTFPLEHSAGNVTGMAFWVKWGLSGDTWLSGGPTEPVAEGELIEWDVHSRQGVYIVREPRKPQKGVETMSCEVTFKPGEGDLQFEFDL